MFKSNPSAPRIFQWIFSRIAVIYIIIFIFCLTCVDLKMLDKRIKIRHLNDAIPDFSALINSSRDQNERQSLDWKPYKRYFELILRYMPDDITAKQLLGYVDYYTGQEQKAIDLFKLSTEFEGKDLFWSNYNLGVLYYKKGMWPQAAQYLLKAVSSNPQLAMLLMANSTVYRQISINPYFKYSLKDEIFDAQSHAYILLLSSLYNLKQYDKVIILANLALENQNLSYKDAFYFYEGLVLFEAGEMDRSFLLFQKSLAIQKDNPEAYYYIANIYQREGQIEQARDFLQVSYVLHRRNDPRFPYDAKTDLRFF